MHSLNNPAQGIFKHLPNFMALEALTWMSTWHLYDPRGASTLTVINSYSAGKGLDAVGAVTVRPWPT